MKLKRIIVLLTLLFVLVACGKQADTNKTNGSTSKETQVTENNTQNQNENIFDYVISYGKHSFPFSVERDGMIYKFFSKDYNYRQTRELTKKENPAIMADVQNTQLIFMLADGTLKFHGITMPPIKADDGKSDFAESYTIAKLEKDKVKKIVSGNFGDLAVLNTDGKLYGIQLDGGSYEIFTKKDEWTKLNNSEHTEPQELKLITDDVKDVRLSSTEMLVLKNNGDLFRYYMDALDGVKVESNIKEIGKILLFDSIGLKEDGTLKLFMSDDRIRDTYADFRVEANFDSIKYDLDVPILTKGSDEYAIFVNNSTPHFENTDFFSDAKLITLHYDSGKVREIGYLQKINYDKFSKLGVGKIRYLSSDFLHSDRSKSGKKESYLQIIDEDNRGFIINDKGEVVRKVEVVDKESIYQITDVRTLK